MMIGCLLVQYCRSYRGLGGYFWRLVHLYSSICRTTVLHEVCSINYILVISHCYCTKQGETAQNLLQQ